MTQLSELEQRKRLLQKDLELAQTRILLGSREMEIGELSKQVTENALRQVIAAIDRERAANNASDSEI